MHSKKIAVTSRNVGPSPVRLEMREGGSGRPILFLHPGIGLRDADPFLERLAGLGRVIAPAHPGFHGSESHASIGSVDDLSYLYLDLLEDVGEPVVVVGASLGGWIALEMASKSNANIAGLVLVDTVGVRFNTRDVQDFADLYALSTAELNERLYHDASRGVIDYPNTPMDQLETIARNRDAEVRLSWSPYLHSPRLGTRLHRVKMPTLVVWGSSDRFAPPAYGQRLAQALPSAEFLTIGDAGHFPHIEQPERLADVVSDFTNSTQVNDFSRKEYAR